ncbi:MAG: hypothetical protein GOMPHAMPRED_002926 [Gomphillus americanus]|uniref:Ataxin-10 homolog n=1 Tax=Gomphillus americanus TaxID=1940652 RepID=A0A8H3EFL8_9LECA|nr:MAG: hypothetical protein GOMPHAMPRED_002926 [Gomphillus americanus]
MSSQPDEAGRQVQLRSAETLSKERRPPVPEDQWPRADVDATWLGMKLILNESQAMFSCRETLTDRCDTKYGDLIKKIFKLSQQQHETRHWLGTSADLWGDYAACLEEAVVQIQDLYQLPRGTEPLEETFTTLVINNATRTLKDFQRINDLILVARNMLVDCPDAQRYAIETTCHHEVFNIIQICIEFNSEGFAGEAGSTHEQSFGRIINSAKTLLVSCLQFLFNILRAGPELRTRTWLELLCLDTEFNIPGSHTEGESVGESKGIKPDAEIPDREFDRAAERLLGSFASSTSGKLLRRLLTDFRNNSFLQLHLDKLYKIGLMDSVRGATMENVTGRLSIQAAHRRIEAAKRALIAPLGLAFAQEIPNQAQIPSNDKDFIKFGKCFYPTEQDFTYQKGLPASPYNLSEIPIILAPSGEIEALPMFILVCIAANGEISNLEEKDRLEQAIRCFFLVRSTTGRMLLRELYIFIAAWDLPEDELFFKSMVNITNSFHQHNLLYDVYNALADPKDIISPGQNILVKLIHHIFKSISDPPELYERRSAKLKSLDTNLIQFLLSRFRNNILPRALAIIWLQGQVRDGVVAAAEDFERANLNLWDMERAYEGVYQFLEFFSALNDNPVWKNYCIQLEIAWDIVELIRYLHKHVPVQPFIIPPPPQQLLSRTSSDSNYPPPQRATSSVGDRVVSLERPYSPAISNHSAPSQTGGRGMSSVPAQADSPPPSTPTTPQPPHTYPWRNLKKMSILVLSGLLYNAPSLRAKIREYDGVLLIASCSEHDENNPYIKEHAVLCLKFLLEGDRENQRLVEELRAREIRSAPGLENLGYRAGVDEAGRVRVWHTKEGDQGQKEEVLLPVIPSETKNIVQPTTTSVPPHPSNTDLETTNPNNDNSKTSQPEAKETTSQTPASTSESHSISSSSSSSNVNNMPSTTTTTTTALPHRGKQQQHPGEL